MKFRKASFEAYRDACSLIYKEIDKEEMKDWWEHIELPRRSSEGSAGYDFVIPFDIEIKANVPIIIPTGIAFDSERKDVCLMILPRSSTGIKYGLRFLNTVPLIDVDNVQGFSENQIFLCTITSKDCILHKGDKFAQAVILPYLITEDDDVCIKNDMSLFSQQGFKPWGFANL